MHTQGDHEGALCAANKSRWFCILHPHLHSFWHIDHAGGRKLSKICLKMHKMQFKQSLMVYKVWKGTLYQSGWSILYRCLEQCWSLLGPCNIISVQYKLDFHVDPSGLSFDLVVSLPITVWIFAPCGRLSVFQKQKINGRLFWVRISWNNCYSWLQVIILFVGPSSAHCLIVVTIPTKDQ